MPPEIKIHARLDYPEGLLPDGRILIRDCFSKGLGAKWGYRFIESWGYNETGFTIFASQRAVNRIILDKVLPILKTTDSQKEEERALLAEATKEELPKVLRNTDYDLLEIDFPDTEVQLQMSSGDNLDLVFRDRLALVQTFVGLLPHVSLARRSTFERIALSKDLLKVARLNTPQNLDELSGFWETPISTRLKPVIS